MKALTVLLLAGGGYLLYRASQSGTATGLPSSDPFNLQLPAGWDTWNPFVPTDSGAGMPSDMLSTDWWQQYLSTLPFIGGNQSVGSTSFQDMANMFATKYGIPTNIFSALVRKESGWVPSLTSPKGAAGLTQLMPGTASDMGVTNPFDPAQSLEGGARYLAQLFQQFGSWPKALAAYNAGPTAVTRYGGIPPYKETQDYVKKILCWAGLGPC